MRDGGRPGDVAGGVLGGGAHVQHGHVAGGDPAQQLFPGDLLYRVAKVGIPGLLDLG